MLTKKCNKEYIHSIIAAANKHCYPGVDAGACRLDDICGWPVINRDLFADDVPILSSSHANALTHPHYWNRAETQPEFNRRFNKYAGSLIGFDFAAHGLVLAGGFVMSLLTRDAHADYHFKDFDFFLVGHDSDVERFAAISALGDHLASTGEIFIKRTAGAITFIEKRTRKKYQVILRGYSTTAEVLHGFDIAASAAAFDGTVTLLTAIGVFALQTSCFPLRLEARRASLEHRIVKYLARGFSIILLNLDVDKFVTDAGKLPFITATDPLFMHAGDSHILARTLGSAGRTRDTEDNFIYENEDNEDLDCTGVGVLSAIMAGRPEGLVAFDKYHPGIDIASVGVPVDLLMATFTAELNKALHKVSSAFSAEMFTGIHPVLAVDDVIASVRARVEAAKIDIPYVLRRVEDDTLINPSKRMSECDWYGSAYTE